ncbi:MAG: 2-oxoacid:acceptor oxidoreductase family protein [Candidatus Edwardsbacteria bacterium]|nr:2-oxoacid:acceptor oxidoreductase family protein [Candidatus Edwardsbacteria bacterium]
MLAKALTRQGYYIYAHQDLMSRIRGGHNFTSIRISDRPVGSSSERANILIALDRNSIDLHAGEMADDGVILYDEKFHTSTGSIRRGGLTTGPLGAHDKLNLFPVPMEKLAVEHGQNKQIANAVACDCSFAARGFAGDAEHLAELIASAIKHPGFALVDILQPCVIFNKVNTYQWYKERVYKLEQSYDPRDRNAAFAKAMEWGERIPIGIIYKNGRPSLESRLPQLKDKPLIGQDIGLDKRRGLIEEFR